MKYDTVKICSMNPLHNWLEHYGVHPNNKGLAKCPFHDEKTASFKVYPNGTYHCFGCGAHGDVITFVMGMEKLPFREACAFLVKEAAEPPKENIHIIKKQRNNEIEQIAHLKRLYWQAFDDLKLCEDIIEEYKPKDSNEQPHEAFLLALSVRGYLKYKLSVAENIRSNIKKQQK